MPLLTLIILCLAGVVFMAATALLVRGTLYRSPRPLALVVAQRRNTAGDLFSLTLRRPGLGRLLPLPRYAAGQSVALTIPGETTKRRYSIARWQALPFAYELTIKREPQGRFSPRLGDYARVGARLEVGRPDGHFTLPENAAARRAVFIAGGVGITPLLAMLDHWAKTRRSYPEVHLYWQVRHEQEALYREALVSLAKKHPKLRVRILVSRPAQGCAEKISASLLGAELESLVNTDFYLCAGSGLLDPMLSDLGEAGVAAESLYFERFTLGGADVAEDWRIHYQGEQFSSAGHASLLDAIEAQRLAIDSDCRTGSCGRCLLAVEEGKAKHRVVPEYAVPPRHVLACCAVPQSDLQLRAVMDGVTAAGHELIAGAD